MANEMADVFGSPAFNMASLTTSMNRLPFTPGRIGSMGLFTPKPITTTIALLEEQKGKLSLIPSKPRGSPASVIPPVKRTVRSVPVPHFPHDSHVKPDDIIGVRQFGSADQMQTVVGVVNDRLTRMKQDHQVTREWLYMGALKGKVLDSDGVGVLADLFTIFSVTEQSFDFKLGTDATKIRQICLKVKRFIEEKLGGVPYDHIHAFCGYDFFQRLIDHKDVLAAYDRFQDGVMRRNDPRSGFPFAGIIFEEYPGSVGDQAFVDPKQARFFPVGAPGLFEVAYAPADQMGAVGTPGLEFYASQALLDHDKGVSIHTQSNPLPYCTVPEVCCKGESTN